MATFDQPSLVPTWCEDNQTNVAQPPDSLRATGYVANETPMAEHFNWLFNSYGNWLGYLDQANAATVMSTSLDINTRLVSGGQWSYNATTATLSWSSDAALSIPSIPLADNDIPAGSVILGDNVVAYVQANVPVTLSGALTSGNQTVTGVETTGALSVGMAVTGAGIPANTTLTAISGNNLTLSQAATASNATAALTFASTGALQVKSAAAQTLAPGPNTVVIAVGRNDGCLVGANSGQMRLDHGESKPLLGSGYVSAFSAPAGYALSANTPVYVSKGAPDNRTAGSFYPCEANSTNGAQRGQFVGFALNTFAQGAQAKIVSSGLVNQFTGLSTGAVYYLDPANVGAITATRPTSSGSFVVPVGLAVSATTLRINPEATRTLTALASGLTVNGVLSVYPGAQGPAVQVYSGDGSQVTSSFTDQGNLNTSVINCTSVVASGGIVAQTSLFGRTVSSASGFKSTIQAGMFYESNYTITSPPTYQFTFVPLVDQTGATTRMIWQQVMTHSGSVIGASYISNSSTNRSGEFVHMLPRLSGTPMGGLQPTSSPAAAQYARATVAPGTYSFSPGDILTVQFYLNSSSTNGAGSYCFTPFLTLVFDA